MSTRFQIVMPHTKLQRCLAICGILETFQLMYSFGDSPFCFRYLFKCTFKVRNDEIVKVVTAPKQINNVIQNPHHGIKEKLILTKGFQK